VRKEIAKCENTPSLIPNLKRFHLNIQTSGATTWLNLEDWLACPTGQDFSGPCYGGLDLASTDDITAFVLYWPETGAILCRFYLPESAAELPSKKHYRPWVESGELTLTAGNVTDYAVVRADIVELHKKYNIDKLGFDPYNANEIATRLYNDHGIACISVGFTMKNVSEASKAIEVATRKRQLHHGNNSVLTWMAGNTLVKTDEGGNIQPSKKFSAGKIDGIAALVTAQAVAISEPQRNSIYEDREMLVL
jgi:phage terminase large subunit-like protein